MKQFREGLDVDMSRLRTIGTVSHTGVSVGLRPALAAPSWPVHLATMPCLDQGYGEGHKTILANGTRRLKEPST